MYQNQNDGKLGHSFEYTINKKCDKCYGHTYKDGHFGLIPETNNHSNHNY